MEEKKWHRKINAGIDFIPGEAVIHKGDKIELNPYWTERLYDYIGYFTIVLEDLIDAKIGKDGWAIYFTRYPEDNPHFRARIFTDDEKHYHTVLAIVKDKVTKDIELDFAYGGDIATYTKLQG